MGSIYSSFQNRLIKITLGQAMNEKVKTHRRNQALEHVQESYRHSVPTFGMELGRHSFAPKQENAQLFRVSDMTNLNKIKNQYPLTKRINLQPQTKAKTQSTLLFTLQSLENKLSEAKKQLTAVCSHQLNESKFDLNSYKESCSSGGRWANQSCISKQQESTINLQSQKKLLTLIRSKQRLVWANKIKTYYLSEICKGIAGINERALEHLNISLQILKSCRQIELPNETQIKRLKVDLPRSSQNQGKKILVLDLDETLIHCEMERNSPDDLEIDFSFQDSCEKAYISIRPYAISFLKRARKYYQIIVFTASEKIYADAILNQIDPDSQLIQHRLYRQHCVKLNNKVYAKDLSIINRDLKDMVLVDNSPFSYIYQIQNGIPILPFYKGQDNQLLGLEKYLDVLRRQRDVRRMNRETFKLYRYAQFQECQELIRELYRGDYYY